MRRVLTQDRHRLVAVDDVERGGVDAGGGGASTSTEATSAPGLPLSGGCVSCSTRPIARRANSTQGVWAAAATPGRGTPGSGTPGEWHARQRATRQHGNRQGRPHRPLPFVTRIAQQHVGVVLQVALPAAPRPDSTLSGPVSAGSTSDTSRIGSNPQPLC